MSDRSETKSVTWSKPAVLPEPISIMSREEKRQLKIDYVQTGLFYCVFITMGSIASILGPTLLDLAKIIQVNPQDIGIIFTFRSIGNVIGAFAGGVIMDKIHVKMAMLCSFGFALAIFTLLIPFSWNLNSMEALCFFVGFSMGGLNNGINVFLLQMWQKKASSFFLTLHFSFGIGALLGPLVASPFLEANRDTSYDRMHQPLKYTKNTEMPTVLWAYVTISGLAFLTTAVLAIFNFFIAKQTRELSVDSSDQLQPPKQYKYLALGLCAIAIFSTGSIESAYAAMIPLYAVEGSLQFTKREASYLTAGYWAAYTVVRFISIFVVAKVNIEKIVTFDVLTLLLGGLILSFSGSYTNIALWLGTIVLGAGIATLFPSSMTWLQKHVPVTYKIGSMFFIMGSAAEMTWPPVLGKHVLVMPNYLYYHVLGFAVACAVLYFTLNVVFNRMGSRSEHSPQHSEEDAEEVNKEESNDDRHTNNELEDSKMTVSTSM